MKSASAKSCPSCGERYETDVLFCPRDGTPLSNSRSPSFNVADRDTYLGIELAGQIRLKHLIGIGSMGRVYRAFQGGIDRDVAVKVLHRELSGNGELVGRFHREAKVASRLIHPNVVQVLMTGTVPFQADPHIGGELYLVMEHLDGISLLSALAAAGTGAGEGAALPLPRALHLVLQICDAVGEAHVQGIVHRDLKPENVMLVRRGDDPDYVKVLDFGIARLDWGDRSMATQAGLIFGTAKYISPEGAEGLPVGPPADVYSIATILYQCLAGRTPFEGDSPVALLVQHTHTPPTDLRSIARASYVPAPLAHVIMQNLAKKPADRAPNARVLGRELVAAARASGLYPEEIATQATLFSPSSAVKLASKERTKSLELSPGLAAQIGGVASVSNAPQGTYRARGEPEEEGAHDPLGGGPRTVLSETPPEVSGGSSHRSSVAETSAHPPSVSGGSQRLPPVEISGPASRALPRTVADEGPPAAPGSSRGGAASERGGTTRSPQRSPSPELDFEDGLPRATLSDLADDHRLDERGPLPQPTQSTSSMQGTETTLGDGGAGRRPRARGRRIAVVIACALAAMPVLILGGRRLGGFGTSAAGDSLDADLAEARDCMRRHAWDAPPQHNLKDLTDRDRARWPDDTRIQDLRREAAEGLVADALGRKYAADVPEAIRLARLALVLNPDLTTAQHLVVDLQGPSPPAVSPATSSGVADRGSAKIVIRRGGKEPRLPASSAPSPPPAAPSPPPAAPSPPPAAPSPPPANPGAVLPPTPPPLPVDHTPPPAPSSTGPWL